MASATRSSGLATVQNLYIMQFQLVEYLQRGLRTDNQVKEAKQCYKEFKTLMKSADKAYMGGEDVYESLSELEKEAAAKLKKRTAKTSNLKK